MVIFIIIIILLSVIRQWSLIYILLNLLLNFYYQKYTINKINIKYQILDIIDIYDHITEIRKLWKIIANFGPNPSVTNFCHCFRWKTKKILSAFYLILEPIN